MYSLYRRHEKPNPQTGQEGCRYFGKGGARHIKCNCPVWMDGTEESTGKRQRVSLKTRSWSQAQARLAEIENGGRALPTAAIDRAPMLASAIASFLDDCRARNLAASSIERYRNMLRHLTAHFGECRLSAMTLDALTQYRAARTAKAAAGTMRAEIGNMRTFFRFCEDREWIEKNPARRLRAPKADREPTLPFTRGEVDRILAACDTVSDTRGDAMAARSRARARALVLLLLYSGLRISDAVKLERAKLDLATGRLLIRMMKTREPLYVRLPQEAVDALAALECESPYFFWNGESQLYSMIRVASRTIERILTRAAVANGHPHRFRDTFAVELLLAGSDLRTVQLLLGHTSIQTTEKHYAPYVASMQRGLDQAVSRLHFGSAPDPQPRVHAAQNAGRNRKSNLLAFRRTMPA
jgi:integrase/recombinase XerD